MAGRFMMQFAAHPKVFLHRKPVDFRKGAEGLAALVREELRSDPFSGTKPLPRIPLISAPFPVRRRPGRPPR